ncbi:hypothetical protein AMATHDRAFT_139360 [Amanita thiersii Skay4041]|uniref:Pentacotripeptide-repeat region of PRORP domain-containing protein n=1 Tax=Amanita thiersii Skay4041 TaxID=703135 RepID=A0A2A9NQ93_9AGAR|nr:hypothetical protein AMATHDRAFT_139360 [Amanita thiersii Skay4041]
MFRNVAPLSLSHRPLLSSPPRIRPCFIHFPNSKFASTRQKQASDVPLNDNEPRLPRYLRRQMAFGKPSSPSRTSPRLVTTHQDKVFRSKHYDPKKIQTPATNMKLLEPHVLSARLKKLCDENKIDAAFSMLKNSPLGSQNTPVWNTLIWEVMKAKRYKLAYQLYVDMKRRGHTPTTRTFQTMFKGLSRIEQWSAHTKQLENARLLYEAYQRHVSLIKKEDPSSPDLNVDPLASYIKILGDAGRFQDIFDVYYAMDTDGPLAPNLFIFTAIFRALATKPDSASDVTVPYLKNAIDAKLVWTQMQKHLRKSPSFQVDSLLVTSAISALMRGGPSEQSLAFQIVCDHFGLGASDEQPACNNALPLQAPSVDIILRLCNSAEKHALCVDFVQKIKRRPETAGGISLLDRVHMEQVLRALLAMVKNTGKDDGGDEALATLEWMLRQEITGKNGPKIRPALSTYNLVMEICWRAADWPSAVRTFELMTGYHAHDFIDGAVSDEPRLDKRSPGRTLYPTAEIMSSMIRTALASQDRANMRQCLRIVHHLGLEAILSHIVNNRQQDSKKVVKDRSFAASKLTSAVIEIIEKVKGDRDSPKETKQWKELSTRASDIQIKFSRTNELSFIPTQAAH